MQLYSQNRKTLELKDDFSTQVITLNSPKNMRHGNCVDQKWNLDGGKGGSGLVGGDKIGVGLWELFGVSG